MEQSFVFLNGSALERQPFADASGARAGRDLKVLLRLTRCITSGASRQTLEAEIVECLWEACAADSIAFITPAQVADDVLTAPAWRRGAGFGHQIRINGAILKRVFSESIAVVRNDERAYAIIPLAAEPPVSNAVYLETGADVGFEESELEVLSGMAVLSGLALEHSSRSEPGAKPTGAALHGMVGNSPLMGEVYDFITRAAPRDSTVLICGESGTGKELVAQAIHANSSRAGRPFMAINCAALTETLLESELFGHERGAITGAVAQKKGKLEVAEGGTVFLDEVGEMSPMLQAKLLRVLQEREFERVGGTRSHKLNIRLIAATNRDLREESQRGVFRQDLYYRLNVVSIEMPPLRSRLEDVPVLAAHFAAKHGVKLGRPVSGVSRKARALLLDYDWPGNVRELENAIERAVVLGSASEIQPEDLPGIVNGKTRVGKSVTTLAEGIREAKRQCIVRALEQTAGNHQEAAALLGVHANHLSRLITTLKLRSKRPLGLAC